MSINDMMFLDNNKPIIFDTLEEKIIHNGKCNYYRH